MIGPWVYRWCLGSRQSQLRHPRSLTLRTRRGLTIILYTGISAIFSRERFTLVASAQSFFWVYAIINLLIHHLCFGCFMSSRDPFFSMAIRPLEAETALLLRASALVVTPSSLIKELVGNAIDAKATSVKIRMTRDGVSHIEVQDNGVGIHQGDFDALGRRAHTSKLRAFQDLPRIGGMSLGFRGEALAAANSLAEVIITTRTSQEKVAHRIYLEQKVGGIKKHDPVPGPVGTTVRIQNLFASIPVRKKTTTDNIQKSIVNVKHFLQAFALARPAIRLSFGITGENKAPWIYSPIKDPTVREAAFQVLGGDLAAQCTSRTMVETAASSPDNRLVEELTEQAISKITVDAFLPKQDADLSTIGKHGPFISVDGRPMTPGRGTMKKIVAAFKARLESFNRGRGIQYTTSNVFIRLDIRCPPGSYDINVSPSKDEVLFTDESRVLKVIDSLLGTAYPATERTERSGGSNNEDLDRLSSEDLELLESFAIEEVRSGDLNGVLQSPSGGSGVSLGCVPDEARQSTSSPRWEEMSSVLKEGHIVPDTTWIIDMSNLCDDDCVSQPAAASVIDQLRSAAIQKGKMHSKNTNANEKQIEDNHPLHTTTSESQQDSMQRLSGSRTLKVDHPNPWTIAIESAKVRQQACHDSGSFTKNSAFNLESEEVDRVFPDDLPLFHSRPMFPISPSPDIHPNGAITCTPPQVAPPQTTGTLQTPPSSNGRNLRQKKPLPRFKPPSMSAPRDHQPQAFRLRGRSQRGQQQAACPDYEVPMAPYDENQVASGSCLDLYVISVDPRALKSTPEPGTMKSGRSPSRLTAADTPARGALETNVLRPTTNAGINDTSTLGDGNSMTMDLTPTHESLDNHDPREYLMKRRRSMSRDRKAGRVLRRVKSSLLPMETIPAELEMHTVALGISTSYADLRSEVLNLVEIDNYVSIGTCHTGLPGNSEGAADVQTRLQTVCAKWAQRTTGRECYLRLNLWSQMKGKSRGLVIAVDGHCGPGVI